MFYRYQSFRYGTEYGDVVILIHPKQGIARVYDQGHDGERLLRELLLKNDWKLRSVAVSARPDTWPVYLHRGEGLLRYLREEGTHNDSALHLITEKEQKDIQTTRDRRRLEAAEQASQRIIGKDEGAGVIVYCVKTNRFLFCVRAGADEVSIFAGRCAPGDDPRLAAARAFQEKAGLEIENPTPQRLIALYPYEDDALLFHNFLLIVTEEQKCIIDPKTIASYTWLPYTEFNKHKMHPGLLRAFEQDTILKKIVLASNRAGINYSQLVDEIVGRAPPPPPENDGPPNLVA